MYTLIDLSVLSFDSLPGVMNDCIYINAGIGINL